MVRLMLASIVGAIGYLLLYAGVADGGRFALRPWDALTQATNAPAPSSDAGASSNGGSGGGVGGAIIGAGKKILSIVPLPIGVP